MPDPRRSHARATKAHEPQGRRKGRRSRDVEPNWWDRARRPIWLASIDFADEDRGWLCGDRCAFWTTDGGATWVRRYDGGLNLQSLSSPDFTHVWMADGRQHGGLPRGRVLSTDDGGATWTTHLRGNAKPLNDIGFIDAAHGWAVGARGSIFVWR